MCSTMRTNNPFENFERVFEQMSRQFEEMNRRFESGPGLGSRRLESGSGSDAGSDRGYDSPQFLSGGGRMDVDVASYDDEFVVVVDLPGYETEDIDLTVDGDRLTIEAERESTSDFEGGEEGDAFLRRERSTRSVRRSIRIPEAVDEEGARASYTNGVLTVTLPKLSPESDDEDDRHIDIE
jgi:HSP20 family protein